MNFAKRVVENLMVSGRMDRNAAETLVAQNAAVVVAGGMLKDAPEDVAHDLFLMIDDASSEDFDDMVVYPPKLRVVS